MSMELFKGMTQIFILHIPFRGSGPATASLLANETQLMFDNLPQQVPLINSGRVRALAVTGLTRSRVMPDLPTLDELGLKGFEVTAWFGLAAPFIGRPFTTGGSRTTVTGLFLALPFTNGGQYGANFHQTQCARLQRVEEVL